MLEHRKSKNSTVNSTAGGDPGKDDNDNENAAEDNEDAGDKKKKKINGAMLCHKPDEEYSLFFLNENWFYFFRLHYILCERLAKMAHRAKLIAEEERAEGIDKKESTAVLLRLKTTRKCFDCLFDLI